MFCELLANDYAEFLHKISLSSKRTTYCRQCEFIISLILCKLILVKRVFFHLRLILLFSDWWEDFTILRNKTKKMHYILYILIIMNIVTPLVPWHLYLTKRKRLIYLCQPDDIIRVPHLHRAMSPNVYTEKELIHIDMVDLT